MRSSLQRFAACRWMTLAALLVAACSSPDKNAANGANGGTILIDETADADFLLPPFANVDVSRAVVDNVFDHLADISPDLQTIGDKSFTPRLAKSWAWAPDSMSIAFSLDPRAQWHDGLPVRANDVRFTFRIYADPKTGSVSSDLVSNIDSVSVRDSLTPVIWFKHRAAEQFYQAANQMEIMPEHVYGSVPAAQLKTSDVARKPIGSGRFRFVRWDPGVRIELIADTANYRGRAKLDRVILTIVETQAAVAQVFTGQTDLVFAFPWDQLGRLDSSKTARGLTVPTIAYTYMAMNPHLKATKQPHPIFGDLAVRRAISMAMDRSAMLKNVFGTVGRLGMGPFPQGVSTTDTTLHVLPYDTVAAKRLLDSAGWHAPSAGAVRVKNGKPLRFQLLYPASSFLRDRYGVLIQDQLRRVGAQVDLLKLDQGASAALVQKSDFDATLFTYSVDEGVDAEKQLWGTAGIGAQGVNIDRYSNPRVDAWLDSAARSYDIGRARTYASQAYQQIIDDAPAVWLYDLISLAAINRRIQVAPLRPDGWWLTLADWTIPPSARIARDRIPLSPGSP